MSFCWRCAANNWQNNGSCVLQNPAWVIHATASSSHLFWLVKLNICGCSFFQGQMYVQQKNMCFAFWARVDTKFLNLTHHVLFMDGWPGDTTFFLWGQPLKIIRLDLIFDTCASTSSSHCFNVCQNEHTYSYPFARTNVSSVKNTCFAIWAHVDQFFGICS